MTNYRIELIPNDKILSIIPLLLLLNSKVDKETLEKRIPEMIKNNYRCVGVYDNDRLIGISGLWVLIKILCWQAYRSR